MQGMLPERRSKPPPTALPRLIAPDTLCLLLDITVRTIGHTPSQIILTMHNNCEPAHPLQRSLGPFGPEVAEKVSTKMSPKRSREQSEKTLSTPKESFQAIF